MKFSTIICCLFVGFLTRNAMADRDPVTGRFLQRDPVATGLPVLNENWYHGRAPLVAPGIFDARWHYNDGMNLYEFVGSNPVTRTDPSGLDWWDDDIDAAMHDYAWGLIGVSNQLAQARADMAKGAKLAALYAAASFLWDDLIRDRDEAILFDLIAGPFFSKICFVEGTAIATPDGPEPIDCLALGREITSQRDPQPSPAGQGAELSPGVDAISLVRLRYCHADGSATTMEVLRPTKLIAALRLAAGCRMPVSLPEMGFAGDVEVLAIEAYCGPINLDVPTVTGRFVTDSAEIVNVYLEGYEHPIGVTPKHPVFSADRQTWVAAAGLEPGERLTTTHGVAVVARVQHCAERFKVYNIEVSQNHTYFVGDAQVWAHNPCELSGEAQQLFKQWKQAGQLEGRSLCAFRSAGEMRLGSSHFDVIRSFPGTNFSSWEYGYVSWINGEWVFRIGY